MAVVEVPEEGAEEADSGVEGAVAHFAAAGVADRFMAAGAARSEVVAGRSEVAAGVARFVAVVAARSEVVDSETVVVPSAAASVEIFVAGDSADSDAASAAATDSSLASAIRRIGRPMIGMTPTITDIPIRITTATRIHTIPTTRMDLTFPTLADRSRNVSLWTTPQMLQF